jgi:hypothetical protein
MGELKQMRDGEGMMASMRAAGSAQVSGRAGVPALNLGGVAAAGDSLDQLAGGAAAPPVGAYGDGDGDDRSWLEIADEDESLAGGSSILVEAAGDDGEGAAAEAGEWEEYYDEEVGAKYYFNTRTQEASWVRPAGM